MAAEFEAEAYAGQNNVQRVDYTPVSAVAAGSVVVLGNTPYVAERDIAANALGAVAERGGAYRCKKSTSESMASGGGEALFWDEANSQFTLVAGSNYHFGTVWPAGAAQAAEFVIATHDPQAVIGDLT